MTKILPLVVPTKANFEPKKFDFDNPIQDPVELADQLWENMKHYKGVGLSANQIGIDAKVFVMGMGEGKDEFRLNVFNPMIMAISDEMSEYTEGCLTYPGLFMKVKRPKTCTVQYYNEKGEDQKFTFDALTSRVWLHEYDHMVGRDFTSRVSKMVFDRAIKKRDKLIKKMVREGKLQPPPKSV